MIRKTIKGGDFKSQMVGELVFDQVPEEGSFNPVTSDAVAKIAGGVADLDAIVPEGASEDNKLATAADVAGVQEDVDTIEGKIPSDASSANKLVSESGLQDAIDNASESWSTGFTPKGESSVSDLNDLTTQSNGDSYIVTDSGTLTDGSLAVVAGDQVAWDATNNVWYKLNPVEYVPKSYAEAHYSPVIDYTNNNFVNGVVKCLYFSNLTAQQVESIDSVIVFNGFNDLYGVVFKAGTTTVSSMASSSAVLKTGIVRSNGSDGGIALIDLSKVEANAHPVIQCSLSLKCIDEKFATDLFGIKTNLYQIYGNNDTNPSDLNDLKDTVVYVVQRTAATTTSNFPTGFPTDSSRAILEVFRSKFTSSIETTVQVLSMLTNSDKWWRVYNHSTGVWSGWQKADNGNGVMEFKVGSGYPYATLRSAIEDAGLFQNARVIIYNGTYDLLTEFADKFTDLFNENVVGLELKNGVHVIAMDGVKITANVPDDGTYTDSELSAFGQYFNPFFSKFSNSFTLENIDIEATNTRYCVHDEHGSVGTYVHKYINCKMKFANTISRSGIAKYVGCIGGGLGEHGTIVVDGGRYESHTVNGASHIGGGDPENHQNCISYHNGNSATCDSSIRITGVYLADRGYIKFGYYGPSTIKSFCEVSGCSFGLPLVIGKEANNDAPANYDVVSWGNEQKVEGVHWEVGEDGYTQDLV